MDVFFMGHHFKSSPVVPLIMSIIMKYDTARYCVKPR